ncbi:MAG: hypothetical protein A4S12_03790 [Proteobacteria bacterium SG_bin5]|nr:DUF2141 domain-containing protein [Sphingomonas sp.]OQW43977.1 MAG: hypothetical protein A4S12_03790 [Proteobacteria bacterium SG_bin5]
MIRFPLAAMLLALAAVPAAGARPQMGGDAAACEAHEGPAIEVHVTGLKDRKGRLKLELYPGNQQDFLRDDRDLEKEGKFFRRIWADTPANGEVLLCIKAPRPGRYGLFFTHDRDAKNKFSIWQDGAGIPSNTRLGRAKPKYAAAEVEVGAGVTSVTIKAQYLKSIFSGFGPL